MMMSSVLTRNGDSLPLSHRSSGIRRKFTAVMHLLYKRCESALLTAVVMLAGAALIVLSFGIHVPFLEGSSKADAVSIVKPIVKPKIVATPKVTSVSACTPLQHQTNVQFSNCPTFLVDYTGQKNGPINTNDFNVYTGKPVANQEAEYYTDNSTNLRVENGSLVLEAKVQPDQGYNYTSARINTQGKEDFLYGKIVVRAIMPAGIGTWPAIWMLPSQPRYYAQSPASDTTRYLNDGEIDLAESIGTQPNKVYGIAHSLAWPEDGVPGTYFNTVTVPGNNTTYHNYEVDWTPTSLTFSIDGVPYFTYTKTANANWVSWPFNQPFYLVINLALGGGWGGSDTAQFPGDGVDKSALPAALKVQSIDYYSYVGQQ